MPSKRTAAPAPAQIDIFGTAGKARAYSMRREPKANGYAARPGTGPEGETCGTCAHCRVKQLARRFYKCALLIAAWTGGRATDICVRSPACSQFVKGAPRETGIR